MISPVEGSNSIGGSTGHYKKEISRGLRSLGDTSIYPKDIYPDQSIQMNTGTQFMYQPPANSYTLTSANML